MRGNKLMPTNEDNFPYSFFWLFPSICFSKSPISLILEVRVSNSNRGIAFVINSMRSSFPQFPGQALTVSEIFMTRASGRFHPTIKSEPYPGPFVPLLTE